MKFSRIYLNRLQEQVAPQDTVVVIDVLRSFTTAAVALDRGAAGIYPVDGVAAAIALAHTLPNSLTVGAIAGGDPAPGFAFGNSPAALLQAELTGKNVVMSTAAGVRGLQRYRGARRLYATSLLTARATAQAIVAAGAEEVCFVITGEWVDRDGDEDIACADYIEALLRGEAVSRSTFAERVRHSDFGQRFVAGTWPNLPLADLELAMQIDRFAFAMPVQQSDTQLLIQAQPVTNERWLR
jgi:2-phosphosulfolactate phosphatase